MATLPIRSTYCFLCSRIYGLAKMGGLIFLIAFFIGCVPAFHVADNFQQPPPSVKVLLMEPDIQLTELTAGGLHEPRADWTEDARKNFSQELTNVFKEREDTIVFYREPEGDPTTLQLHNQLIKLHEVVGKTILIHKYLTAYALPTKSDKFDWSLGENVKTLREQSNADYALVVFIRDSYASAGRVALIIAGAILGVGISGGVQSGFASLVDLRTGQIVWFNKLLRETGDLRTLESAREAVEQLLANIPL